MVIVLNLSTKANVWESNPPKATYHSLRFYEENVFSTTSRLRQAAPTTPTTCLVTDDDFRAGTAPLQGWQNPGGCVGALTARPDTGI